jgi:hypothetical protein
MARACGGDGLTEEWIGAGTLDPWQQTMGLDLDAMLEDLGKAKEGSVFVLHTYESYGMSCRVSLLHPCAREQSETRAMSDSRTHGSGKRGGMCRQCSVPDVYATQRKSKRAGNTILT